MKKQLTLFIPLVLLLTLWTGMKAQPGLNGALPPHLQCIDPSLIQPNAVIPAVYIPVCGCDGITYSNKEEAQFYYGVTSWTDGPCKNNCNFTVAPGVPKQTCLFGRVEFAIKSNSKLNYSVFLDFDVNPVLSAQVKDAFVLEGLLPGFHIITVVDASGCKTKTRILVERPKSNPLDAKVLNASCRGSFDGAIDLQPPSVAGFNGMYRWRGPNGFRADTEDIKGLAPGVYAVEVTNSQGDCYGWGIYEVKAESGITAEFRYTSKPCSDVVSGCVTIKGGVAPYRLLIFKGKTNLPVIITPGTLPTIPGLTLVDPPFLLPSTPNQFEFCGTDLPEGIFTLLLFDSKGCYETITLEIPPSTPLQLKATATPTSCNNQKDGSIRLDIEGGVAPYSIVWQSNGNTGTNLDGLAPGLYQIKVSDSNQCIGYIEVRVGEGADIKLEAKITSASCNNKDGSIDLMVRGGTAPYTFTWSNGAATEDLGNLPAGIYKVLVKDANGCVADAKFEVLSRNGLELKLEAKPSSCNADDGSINLTIINGTAPFQIKWSNGATTEDIDNLAPGGYSVRVEDANGCVAEDKILVKSSGRIELAAKITPATCGLKNGAIDLSILNGKAPYTIKWSNGATTEDISDLPGGTYIVRVEDANGCVGEAKFLVDNDGRIELKGNIANATCGLQNGKIDLTIINGSAPFQIKWSNGATTEDIDKLSAGRYVVRVVDANGCVGEAEFDVKSTGKIELKAVVTDASCGAKNGKIDLTIISGTGPFTIKWSNGATTEDIDQLEAGKYVVRVVDVNGCVGEGEYQVKAVQTLSLKAIIADATCGKDNGSIDLKVSGGTAPYTFTWSNGASTEDIRGLQAGVYKVVVKDANGCLADGRFEVKNLPGFDLKGTVTNATCGQDNGSINAEVVGGKAPFRYSWSNNADTEDLRNLAPGTYTLNVTDANGCTATKTFEVKNDELILNLNYDPFGSRACVKPEGGKDPYTVYWIDLQTGDTLKSNHPFCIDGLPEGQYIVVVKDASGCEGSEIFFVDKPVCAGGIATVNPDRIRSGQRTNFSLRQWSGISMQWQIRIQGLNTWLNLPGATTPSYRTPVFRSVRDRVVYVRARVSCANQQIEFSTLDTFFIEGVLFAPGTGSGVVREEEVIDLDKLMEVPSFVATPNLTTDFSTMTFQGYPGAKAEMAIYNAQGMLMQTQQFDALYPGDQYQLDVQSWPSGLYLVHIVMDKVVQQQLKIQVAH